MGCRMFDPSQWVTAAQLDGLIRSSFDDRLQSADFERTGRRRWVRSRIAGIRDLFEFVSLRSVLNPRWGFSLDYCPTVENRRLKWHRTVKSARIDVVNDPIDYVDAPSREMDLWTVSSLQSEPDARSCVQALADRAMPAALKWFASVNSAPDLLALLAAKKGESAVRFGFRNHVQQPLALALTYAQLGETQTAERLLDDYVSDYDVAPDAATKLRTLLAPPSP